MDDLISRQEAITAIKNLFWRGYLVEDSVKAVSRISSSQPEIIKCKDCEHWRLNDYENVETCWQHRNIDGSEQATNPDDFCSRAKRREDGSN